jgi:hypothetical protein
MFPELPKNERSFTVEAVGDTSGHKYEGIFTVKCVLSMQDKHRLELEKTRLLSDFMNPTSQLQAIAVIMANVRARVIQSPEWWRQSDFGNKILDENVIVAIYDKAMEAEDEWKADIAKKAAASAPASEKTEETPKGN